MNSVPPVRLGAVAFIVITWIAILQSLARVATFDGWSPVWWYLGMIAAFTALAASLATIVLFVGAKAGKTKIP